MTKCTDSVVQFETVKAFFAVVCNYLRVRATVATMLWRCQPDSVTPLPLVTQFTFYQSPSLSKVYCHLNPYLKHPSVVLATVLRETL